MTKIKIAVLDDYQQVALEMVNWTVLNDIAEITVFNDHLHDKEALVERLKPFTIISAMRERTPFSKELLSSLPNLKLIVSTGARNASIDSAAMNELSIELAHTGYLGNGAPELTWALLMAIAKKIPQENESLKNGGWQTGVGIDLQGKTIGIIGLGKIGEKISEIAGAFNMNVIAWSQNLKKDAAAAKGARLVSKEVLLRNADFVTIHLVLSDRSRGIIGADELALMKKSAYLINTSRGPLIDEQALTHVLEKQQIDGAALDVFDTEPLNENHPFRSLSNVLATPHIGYVTENTYKLFFEDTVKIIKSWIEQQDK